MGVQTIARRSAFTTIELVIVVVVVAILTLAAMPDGDTEAKEEGQRACMRFESDIAYARSLAIALPDAADPVIIKVDIANNRYWLARTSAPDTPIAHPWTGQPYLVQFGASGEKGLRNVQILAHDLGGDDILGFDAVGSTDQQTPAILQLTASGASYEMEVAPAAADVTTYKALNTRLTNPSDAGMQGAPADGGMTF